jgi:monofunctional biosynthetic peptidoglycan transglycosylase
MKVIRRIGKFLWKSALWFFGLSIGLVILYRFVPVPITPLMVIRLVEQGLDPEKEFRLVKDWVPISEMSKHAPQAVVASEDQTFMKHNGFDFKSMKKAWESNKTNNRVRGASTISQQTAKNVFLWPSRSYIRKGFEAYFTVLIEIFWSKERILEVYLNVIEMGDGVYGIQAASQTFFDKDASKLSKGQAALIAAVLPNPRRWSPARPTSYIQGRKSWIMRQMSNLGPIGFGI